MSRLANQECVIDPRFPSSTPAKSQSKPVVLIQIIKKLFLALSFSALCGVPTVVKAQTTSSDLAPLPAKQEPGVAAPGKTSAGEDKRVLGVLPNYRTAEMNAIGQPLTAEQKLKIAVKDSFDYPLVLLGAAYAGLYQLEDSHPQFGQGFKGYTKRFGTSYTDQVAGNMMAEAFLPILLRQDPRYFRMSEGSKGQRAWYAISRIVVTRNDSGQKAFNYSEVLGNGISAGIGLSYYRDNRNVPDYLSNWGIQLATDATSQLLKEFWPDVKRWWIVRHHKDTFSTP